MRKENNVCENSGTQQGPACLGHVVRGPVGVRLAAAQEPYLGKLFLFVEGSRVDIRLIFFMLHKNAVMKIFLHILLTTLWSYNLHTIKFTRLTCTSQ